MSKNNNNKREEKKIDGRMMKIKHTWKYSMHAKEEETATIPSDQVQ